MTKTENDDYLQQKFTLICPKRTPYQCFWSPELINYHPYGCLSYQILEYNEKSPCLFIA